MKFHSIGNYFGNPFPITAMRTREQSIASFRQYAQERMESDQNFAEAVRGLKDKTLVCFCKPLACHGDVYVELVDLEN